MMSHGNVWKISRTLALGAGVLLSWRSAELLAAGDPPNSPPLADSVRQPAVLVVPAAPPAWSDTAAVPPTQASPQPVPALPPPGLHRAESVPLQKAAPPFARPSEPWKILIRPQVYRANDPWEYVRTGQVNWNAGPASAPSTASQNPSREPVTGEGGACPGSPLAANYQTIYESIPFNRMEYEANPAYRHEAAMEILFGALRPTTVVKQNQPYFSRYPDLFRYRHSVYPYLVPGSGSVDINHTWNYPGIW